MYCLSGLLSSVVERWKKSKAQVHSKEQCLVLRPTQESCLNVKERKIHKTCYAQTKHLQAIFSLMLFLKDLEVPASSNTENVFHHFESGKTK